MKVIEEISKVKINLKIHSFIIKCGMYAIKVVTQNIIIDGKITCENNSFIDKPQCLFT